MQKELLLLGIYLLLLTYLALSRRKHLLTVALVAAAIGMIWTLLVRDEYSYNVATITIMDVNLYAFIGWSLGLLIGYLLYSAAYRIVEVTSWWQKLLLFNVTYVPLLILVETISYHALNVVNVATATYIGLPLCDCIHAPVWMQIAYLGMGSVFLLTVLAIESRIATLIATTHPDTDPTIA